VIVQSGIPPYRMRCTLCGAVWDPDPAKSGPNKGAHTESSLDRAATDHYATCEGDLR